MFPLWKKSNRAATYSLHHHSSDQDEIAPFSYLLSIFSSLHLPLFKAVSPRNNRKYCEEGRNYSGTDLLRVASTPILYVFLSMASAYIGADSSSVTDLPG